MTEIARVADYMATDLVTLSPDAEINSAMNSLLKHRISGAPVVDDGGTLVGVLTKKDCLRAAIQASYYREWGATVAAHMSKDVKTIDAGTDVLAAAKAFVDSNYRRFPVMQGGRLVGQISRTDVLRAMAENWG